MMNHHAGRTKSNDYWLASLSHSWIDGEDPSRMNDFYTSADGISARELRESANE
ncbi:MAG: hypothetical protein JST42_25630 [Bacteroidetes bacterium]|nr:hypothetical protein [Bacteroidota bacterium]